MKPLFTDSPAAWTRTPRVSQTLAEYGSAIEHVASARSWRWADRALLVLLAAVLIAVLTGAV